jgi:phospholipase/carboxylesterase
MNRRELLGGLAATLLAAREPRCDPASSIRMDMRVHSPREPALAAGRHEVGSPHAREAWIYMPARLSAGNAPLLILLHGAGQSADLFQPAAQHADSHGVVLLVPASTGQTWDGIRGEFGGDVKALRGMLEWTLDRVPVDARRLCVGGFSDGASYALALGLANGDLFSHILALSPGFIPSRARTGRPRIFVTHGTRDSILPIDRTSRTLVPALKQAGYAVEFHEFDGPHTVTPALLDRAFGWLAAGQAG